MCDGLGKTKNLFLLALCGEKQVLMAVGEPLERGGALDGWVKIRQRSVPIFLSDGMKFVNSCF